MLAIFDRVLADIARQRVDRHRRSRSRALYETLNGHWEKFAPATTAEALRHHYTWRCVARIPATWLARTATEPWLTTKRGKKAAPMDVAIDTPMMRLTR